MKNVYIFTLNGCLHCTYIKTKLTELSILFHDIEITQNRQLWEQIISQTGYDITPTILIQESNDNSGLVYIPGRDFQSSDEIIEIIKNQYLEKGD
jgi:glutaredoxin